jgi:sulfonate transport system permease protein
VSDSTAVRPRAGWAILGGAIVPLALVAVWWIVSAAGRLPSPADVAVAGIDLAQRGLLLEHLAASGRRVLLGFAFGSAAGLLLGALIGLSRAASVLLSPLLGALRAVPTLAWLPLLLFALGIGEAPKIVLISIGAALPVFASLAGALRLPDARPPDARPADRRAVIEATVGGLRQALAQSWLFMVAAELLSSTTGLGVLLIQSGANGRTDRLLLTIILLAVLARSTDGLLGLIERRVRDRRR